MDRELIPTFDQTSDLDLVTIIHNAAKTLVDKAKMPSPQYYEAIDRLRSDHIAAPFLRELATNPFTKIKEAQDKEIADKFRDLVKITSRYRQTE